jgi:hypothetical protein
MLNFNSVQQIRIMNIRSIFLLIAFTIISISFKNDKNQHQTLNNKKLIHSLKDKKGNLLGMVYIEDFKNNVFKKLLITKGKKDTLYFINDYLFTNPKGIDIQFDKETFNGYKIESLKNDAIQLFGIGKGSAGASDPVTIVWNYNKKVFEVFQTP